MGEVYNISISRILEMRRFEAIQAEGWSMM